MRFIHHSLMAVAVLAVSATGGVASTAPMPSLSATAMVRFTNNMATNATLSSNGTVLFADTESSRTTGWAQVQDTTATFSLTVSGQEGQTASATEKLADGAQYTVTAAPGTEGRPVLTVTKEPKDTSRS